MSGEADDTSRTEYLEAQSEPKLSMYSESENLYQEMPTSSGLDSGHEDEKFIKRNSPGNLRARLGSMLPIGFPFLPPITFRGKPEDGIDPFDNSKLLKIRLSKTKKQIIDGYM